MNNFELIDDYLTNKLGEAEKAAFEKQLESDPALKADVALQNQILEGVRKARAAELKTMLQNVPIGGSAISWPVLRMAAGIVGAGVLIAGLSYYFRSHENINPSSLSTSIEDSIKQKEKTTEPMEEKKVEPTLEEAKNNESVKVVEEKKPVEKKKEDLKPLKANQPKIEAVDPSNEMIDNSSSHSLTQAESAKSVITASHIAVETDSSNKKYSFHYQFNKGKLMLFGTFDKGLYEILEINSDTHSVFMFYKDNYYLLDEKQAKITLLEPIKDKALVAKLKEYRGW